MNEIKIVIISKSENLPSMQCKKLFHSDEMFKIIEKTPGQKPYMVIAYDKENIVAHMLVMLRRRGSLFPPYLFTQGRAYGEGEYSPDCNNKEEIFGEMLKSITRELRKALCLYIEFSDLSTKMFGYSKFRNNGFFPVHWMEIHNSLHSMKPEKRLTYKMRKLLINANRAGLKTNISTTDKELNDFFKILKNYISIKIRRYIPDIKLFREMLNNGCCNLFTTTHKGTMVGGCICVYSENNCYMWYLAAKKNFFTKRTNAITAWTAIRHAYAEGYNHIYFMDVGLPFKRNNFREFILSFGGKPVGTYRWFRCSIKWINKLLSWSYRE